MCSRVVWEWVTRVGRGESRRHHSSCARVRHSPEWEVEITEAMRAAGPWTVADLDRLPDDGQRYEIVDGSLLVSPPPSPRHQAAAGRLARLLAAAAGPGLEVLEATGIQLPSAVLVPDVLLVRVEALRRDTAVLDPADVLLVAEVVSPSSRTTDRVTKPALYAAAGIPAYWRVELDEPALVAYELQGTTYAESAASTGTEVIEVERPLVLRIIPADLARVG